MTEFLTPPAQLNGLGSHLILELKGCDSSLLRDNARMAEGFEKAVKDAGATVVNSVFHHFNPIGLSGVVVIAESHVTLHTWPEHGYVAVDAFTCGDDDLLKSIESRLIHFFSPQSIESKILPRGRNVI